MSRKPENTAVYFFEINHERWETRKIEIRQDGTSGYATIDSEFGGVIRGDSQMPALTDIAAEDGIYPIEITKEEFEKVWDKITKK